MARAKEPVVEENALNDAAEIVAADEVTPEVTPEPEYIPASTLAEMEAGRATLAKLAESAKAE